MGALAVTLTGTNTGHSSAWLEYTESNIDTINNTSTMTFKLYLQSDGAGTSWRGQPRTLYFTVAGSQYAYSCTFDTRKAHTECLFTHTQTFTHSADGTFSTPVIISFVTDLNGVSGMYLSETWIPFTTIARKSTAKLSKTSVNIGERITVTINTASTSFRHTVYAMFGTTRYAIASNTADTTIPWDLPASMANIIPNATLGSGTIVVDTYSGGTHIGSNSYQFKASVPNTAAYLPKISSFDAIRVNGVVPSSWMLYVKNLSKVKLSVAATGVYGSTIKTYAITGPSVSSSEPTVTSGFLTTVGTLTYTAVVTDTRGHKASTTLTISVVDYTAPTITKATAVRCQADGTLDDEGTYVKLNLAATVNTVSGKNTPVYAYRYRQSGGSWSDYTAIATDIDIIIGDTFSVDYTYDFEFTVGDTFSTAVKTVTVGTSYSLLDFLHGGKGLAIGKAATTENLFDVAIPTKFALPMYTQGMFVGTDRGYIYPESGTGGIYMRTCATAGSTSYRYYAFTNESLNVNGADIVGVSKLQCGAITTTGVNGLRQTFNGYGQLWRFDGTALYLLFTNKDDAQGTYNSLRPMAVKTTTGDITFGHNVTISSVSSSSMSDYIVSKGTSGNWYYWKWASGLAICIHSSMSPGNFTGVAWGSVYDTGDMAWTFSDYPFTFVDVPFAYAARTTADSATYNGYYTWITMQGGSTTAPPQFMLARGTQTTIGHPYLRLVAIGRWK